MNKSLATIVILACCSLGRIAAQANEYLIVKGNLDVGFSRPINRPVQFPIGYTDAQLFPHEQVPNLGYQYSLAALIPTIQSFSIGFHAYLSDYSFTETGEELSYWTDTFSPYAIERSFKMYGIGILLGFRIYDTKIEKLQVYGGVNFGEFISVENVHLSRNEDHKRNKLLASFSIEYGRLIADKLYLVGGLTSSISMNDFYSTIPYRPITYGVTLGIEKQFASKQ